MDKNTLSEYGWIIVVVILLALILAFIPALSAVIDNGANDYVSKYFDDDDGPNGALTPPLLSVAGADLIIEATCSNVQAYDIIIDTIGEDSVDAKLPKTYYDISHLPDGKYEIQVVSTAYGLENSSPSKTTVTLPTPQSGAGTLTKPTLSVSGSTLTINKGSPETEIYKISIDDVVVATMDATNPTTYDLSSLSPGTHPISVVAKAVGWTDSDAATAEYTNSGVITQEDIDNSNGHLVPIGKTDPLYVIAQFNEDFTSVTIFKNGAESDGIMMDFDATYNSPFARVTYESIEYSFEDWKEQRNYIEDEQYYERTGEHLAQDELPHTDSGLQELDFNGDGLVTWQDSEDLLYYITYTPELSVSSDTSIVSAVIKDGVVNLGENLFQGCFLLKSVFVTESVTSVGLGAFDLLCGGYFTYGLYPPAINFETATAPDGFAASGYPTAATINYNFQ